MPIKLQKGMRVEIVPSEAYTSHFVGLLGTIEQLTKPYWMARVKLDSRPDPMAFWIEELRVLEAKPEHSLEEEQAS